MPNNSERIFRLIETTLLSFWQQGIPCNQCGRISLTNGAETKLTVPLSPRIKNGTLPEYLQKYFREVVSYTCDGCQDHRDRAKTRTFTSSADILCVQLSLVDKNFRKIDYSCGIPTLLDLSPLSSEPGSQRYELKSVIKHNGRANTGHYVASLVDSTGQWKLFNDSSVSASSAGFATSMSGKEFGGPVLCFFQRVRS